MSDSVEKTIRETRRDIEAEEDRGGKADGARISGLQRYAEALEAKAARNAECVDTVNIYREYKDGTVRRRSCARVDIDWWQEQGFRLDGGDALEAAPVKTPKKKKATDQVEATD